MTVKQDSLIGQSIGNYRVDSLLGKGAMGEVYLGEHPQIGRKVAIKVLVASLSADQNMADRFMSEARAVNAINHPNVIQIFDFGQLPDGRLYFTMEFLDGRELTELLKDRAPLNLGQTLELLRQMAASLDAAHAKGIVHRDLKPDNVFVMEGPAGPVVKILDFGIAKLLEPGMGSHTKTSTGMIMGTPMYMSPEQAAGDVNRISPRTDIYALAVIVYQMLSGHLPLQAPSVAQLLAMQITEPPRPLQEVTEGLPEAVCDTVSRSLAKEPDERHQSAGEFYQSFVQACAGM
jgi:serine/threonine-protein kinase